MGDADDFVTGDLVLLVLQGVETVKIVLPAAFYSEESAVSLKK